MWATALLLAAPAATGGAHEVPADVTVQAYVRPADGSLTALFRVPLEAMRDMEWPLRGPGYLVLDGIEPLLRDAARIWIADYVTFYQDGRPLADERIEAVRVSVPSDRSFDSFEGALAHLAAPPLRDPRDLPPGQALLDVRVEVPITSAEGRFSVDPGLAHLGIETNTVLHFLPPDGGERVFHYRGDPGRVRLDPRWWQAAASFVRLGFEHILGGLDHLLFVLCLVLPVRRLGTLVAVVTAFTVAHSITLAGAALGLTPAVLWFAPLVETLIAASIVYMAVENIVGVRWSARWAVAFAFGLVHGFGFSFFLAESLQFAGPHLLLSLFAFNVGVELGQLLVVAALVPLLAFTVGRMRSPRLGVAVVSAFVAHTAWHWFTDRGGNLLEYRIALPPLDVGRLGGWALMAALAAAAAWLLSWAFGRWRALAPVPERAPPEGAPGRAIPDAP